MVRSVNHVFNMVPTAEGTDPLGYIISLNLRRRRRADAHSCVRPGGAAFGVAGRSEWRTGERGAKAGA
jgi:hypothetical protein